MNRRLKIVVRIFTFPFVMPYFMMHILFAFFELITDAWEEYM